MVAWRLGWTESALGRSGIVVNMHSAGSAFQVVGHGATIGDVKLGPQVGVEPRPPPEVARDKPLRPLLPFSERPPLMHHLTVETVQVHKKSGRYLAVHTLTVVRGGAVVAAGGVRTRGWAWRRYHRRRRGRGRDRILPRKHDTLRVKAHVLDEELVEVNILGELEAKAQVSFEAWLPEKRVVDRGGGLVVPTPVPIIVQARISVRPRYVGLRQLAQERVGSWL